MNKRILNIVLIICLIIIWFFVFKKIFYKKMNEEGILYNDNISQYGRTFIKIEKDTFNLLVLDKDPFEKPKKRYRKKIVLNKSSSTKYKEKLISKSSKKTTISSGWPKISYYGFVKGTKNEDRLALVKVDNKLHRARKKTIIDEEISIILIYADSILVKRQGEQKIIVRK